MQMLTLTNFFVLGLNLWRPPLYAPNHNTPSESSLIDLTFLELSSFMFPEEGRYEINMLFFLSNSASPPFSNPIYRTPFLDLYIDRILSNRLKPLFFPIPIISFLSANNFLISLSGKPFLLIGFGLQYWNVKFLSVSLFNPPPCVPIHRTLE